VHVVKPHVEAMGAQHVFVCVRQRHRKLWPVFIYQLTHAFIYFFI
jgi:hypothetical protein